MCGICGFTGEIEQREETLRKMTEVITHRGPNSDGYFSDDYISMGFRRLSPTRTVIWCLPLTAKSTTIRI